MTFPGLAVLAVVSVWSCPELQGRHAALRVEFVQALGRGDASGMESACRRGIALIPEDPVWHYNLACSLARKGEKDAALEALDKAVAAGYRRPGEIEADSDLKILAGDPRFAAALVKAAAPAIGADAEGPFMSYPASSPEGQTIIVGAENMKWDFDAGLFEADVDAGQPTESEPYAGLAYVNLDSRHSVLNVYEFPGLKNLVLDQEVAGRFWQNFAFTRFPCPVFGNCSRANVSGRYWRSLPRGMMTRDAPRMMSQACRDYLSNQIWAYPSAKDTDVSTNAFGDVCSAVAPYWIFTHGYSWTDVPYIRLAISATGAMQPETRREATARGLLAPTVQMLLRKSLNGVSREEDYLSPAAHPTAFPPGGVNASRLNALASSLRPDGIPPVAMITAVASYPPLEPPDVPEIVYISPCACSIVLRSPDTLRRFAVRAGGAEEYAFAVVHGSAEVEKVQQDSAVVRLDTQKMSFTNRVDVAVFARNRATSWGAPSFVSFAIVDPSAPYADPMLLPREAEKAGDE